jgi:hypothetical protein
MRLMKKRVSCLPLLNLKFFAAAVFAAAFLSLSLLHAGIVIEGELIPSDGGSGTGSFVAVSDGKARTESVVNGQKMTMIYRGDKDLFWILDNSAGTYREVTRADMRKMMEQVGKAMQQMKEQMAALPPEQRKMMEKMMGGQLRAFDRKEVPPAIDYVKIGDGGDVAGWSTIKYKGTLDGTKVSEVWVAPAAVARVGSAEMKTLENMMSFFREIVGKFGGGSLTTIGPVGGLDGVPIKVVTYSNGTPVSTYAVTSIAQKDLPASEFEVPAGYTKQELAPVMQ